VVAGAACAQIPTSANVFVGYSFSRTNGVGNTTNLNGWEASLEGKLLPWIGIVADFGGGYGSGGLPISCAIAFCNNSGGSLRRYTYLFGPRVSVPVGRFTPFAHALFGAAHINTVGFTDTSFATALGGGLDYRLIHGVAWRFQGDALHTNLYGQSGNYFRFATGIDFRF
jgi:hypothetical protein